jgi:hypothetical protein
MDRLGHAESTQEESEDLIGAMGRRYHSGSLADNGFQKGEGLLEGQILPRVIWDVLLELEWRMLSC